ncbi:hypothetical protein pEaSNUABM11_00073 [Erwinia phage pEa_SNUABM_11]|nr:hypothetical protein pEaSNUABM11_00073 [Erwinia phage pEa_SNUABM_11]
MVSKLEFLEQVRAFEEIDFDLVGETAENYRPYTGGSTNAKLPKTARITTFVQRLIRQYEIPPQSIMIRIAEDATVPADQLLLMESSILIGDLRKLKTHRETRDGLTLHGKSILLTPPVREVFAVPGFELWALYLTERSLIRVVREVARGQKWFIEDSDMRLVVDLFTNVKGEVVIAQGVNDYVPIVYEGTHLTIHEQRIYRIKR